jgi:hypothetical protein
MLVFNQITLIFASEKNVTLPMDCHIIPQHSDSLCIVETPSSDMPVNDIVFYRKDEFDRFVLLEAIKGDIAYVFIKGFSTGGKYTIIGYAEEGHPSYIIYETDTFLSAERPIDMVALVSDYFITNMLSLDDEGNAHSQRYSKRRELYNINPTSRVQQHRALSYPLFNI